MNKSNWVFSALCLTLVCGAVSPAAAQTGTLKGQFVFDGKAPEPKALDTSKEAFCVPHKLTDEALLVGPDGGIKNIVVYVRTKDVKVTDAAKAGEKEKVELDNKDCRFEPHILPMLVKQTLVIKNADPISHNSNITELGGAGTNPLIAANAEATYKYSRAQTIPQPVSCNIHPWMKAYVLPRDNPYAAVTDADGKFEIKDLPPGKLEFQVWQESAGNFKDAKVPGWKMGRFEYEVKAGDNDLGVIKLDPKLFTK